MAMPLIERIRIIEDLARSERRLEQEARLRAEEYEQAVHRLQELKAREAEEVEKSLKTIEEVIKYEIDR